MSFLDFLASLFGRRRAPTPDPDPMLPAQVIRMAYGSDPAQFIDLYLPKRRASQLVPVIIMVHGGGWRRGDADSDNVVTNKVAYWNPKGYAIASISYRLGIDSVPPVDPYTQAQDVANAFAFLQTKQGLDATRFVRMGHSAGAHLVMLVCTHPSLARIAGPYAGAVSLDSAVYDVIAAMNGPHPSLYDDAFGTDQTYWLKCSPQQQMRSLLPPMLLVYSTQRGPANRIGTENFANKALTLGTEVQVMPVDLSHGEVNSTLGLPGAYTDAVDAAIQNFLN